MSLTLLALACGWGQPTQPALPTEPALSTEPALPTAAPAPGAARVMLLITLDTTRVDALGMYGGPIAASPNLDALARRGVRFEWAMAHAPTTLSSHCSMFSGLDPHGHAIPRNGYGVGEPIVTLPELMGAAGWDTLAVVGASAVDRSTNLQSGFRLYDDQLGIERGRRYEATGEQVTERALALVDRRDRDRPLLLWVHYYDAHSPYEASPEWSRPFVRADYSPPWEGDGLAEVAEQVRHGRPDPEQLAHLRGLYQGEVRFMDHQVGLLLEGLEQRGLLEQGWIVVSADHGEMFYEELARPVGHGADVDLGVSHVPMFFVGLGDSALEPGVVSQPVAVSDLGPTMLALAGLPGGLAGGHDLSPLLHGEPLAPWPIYLEASRPDSGGPGWNNSTAERGVVTQGHLFLLAPWLGTRGLYALSAKQPRVLNPALQEQLRVELAAWDDASPPYVEENMSASVREALRALGYLE